MSSRKIQVKALEQKIERLQAQLDYLKKLDELEKKQSLELEESEKEIK